MSLTIREALKFGGLFGAKVVAGEDGLDTPIESVSVLEVAESNISKWVLNNQLYITSFYAICENIEQQKIVIETLCDHGCCGLVLCYVGTWVRQIDEAIIELCNKNVFPLIQARTDVSYIEIMNPIINFLYEEDSQVIEINDYSIVRDDFLDLIANEEDTNVIFRQMNQRLGKKISYYDTYCKLLFSDREEHVVKAECEYLEENFNYVLYACSKRGYAIEEIQGIKRLVVLIRSRKNLFGLFITDYEPECFEDIERNLIYPLVVSGALILQKHNRMEKLREKAIQDYVADLLVWNFPSNDKAVERGKELGFAIEDKNYVVLVNINSMQRETDTKVQLEIQSYVQRVILAKIEYLIRSYNISNWLTLRSDTIILLLNNKNEFMNMRKFCDDLLKVFESRFNLSISVGVSNSFGQVTKIPEAYQQAFHAAVIGREYFGENRAVSCDSVFFLNELRRMSGSEEVRSICLKYLYPLIQYDNDNGTELVNTLECLIENNGNTSKTAQQMYVHKNTILQRKAKIIELLGYVPFEMPYLLNLMISFVVLKSK